MSVQARLHILLGAAVVVCVIGTVDAAIGEVWDLVSLFATLGALCVGSLVALRSHRTPVGVRDDLGRWLRLRSATTGESVEALADRALAAYRADLTRDS